MKLEFSILLILLFCTTIRAQIKWNANRPLTWKDFSGAIDYSSQHFANTKTSTNYEYHVHYHNNMYTLTFKVECVFVSNGSWCKPYKQSNELLRHEQLHFDIEEIFARKLLALLNAQIFTANYIAEVKAIYNANAQQANIMQKHYDQETNYYEIKQEQLKWEKLVHKLLQ